MAEQLKDAKKKDDELVLSRATASVLAHELSYYVGGELSVLSHALDYHCDEDTPRNHTQNALNYMLSEAIGRALGCLNGALETLYDATGEIEKFKPFKGFKG